ncbi:MAG TPA: sulfite exporter TauE/SafE family protein, partial [Burkholderiaceae bacterium]
MNVALLLAALGLGIAASPHCALMCSAPCASLTSGCRRSGVGFHLGRMLGYALAGALAASSVAALAAASRAAPALRPLWELLQLTFLALGLWWLATGRQPAWARRDGSSPLRFLPPGQR